MCRNNFIDCPEHKRDLSEYFFDYSAKFFAFNWCTSTNRLLCGTTLQIKASDYYNKRKKNK